MSFPEWSFIVGAVLSVGLAAGPWMFKVHAKLAVIASKIVDLCEKMDRTGEEHRRLWEVVQPPRIAARHARRAAVAHRREAAGGLTQGGFLRQCTSTDARRGRTLLPGRKNGDRQHANSRSHQGLSPRAGPATLRPHPRNWRTHPPSAAGRHARRAGRDRLRRRAGGARAGRRLVATARRSPAGRTDARGLVPVLVRGRDRRGSAQSCWPRSIHWLPWPKPTPSCCADCWTRWKPTAAACGPCWIDLARAESAGERRRSSNPATDVIVPASYQVVVECQDEDAAARRLRADERRRVQVPRAFACEDATMPVR